jgi:5'-3' exonuclease
VLSEYKVSTKNFLMYRMLLGDTSDNIPGIDGCGKVTIPKYLPFLEESSKKTISDVIDYAKEKNSGKKKLQFFTKIIENEDKLKLNEQLMQLSYPDISGHAVSKIMECLNTPIQPMNKFEIHVMYIHDKLSSAMKNVNEWLTTSFTLLNSFAQNSGQGGSLKDLITKTGKE